MIKHVLLDNNFTKQLKRLHQAGGLAKAAAEHAEAIIQQWVSGEVKRPRQLTRNTRFGELRIKNCLKYDLVKYYRLLAVMDEDELIFLFVGNHNECDQWIYHNSGWQPGVEKRGMKILRVQTVAQRTVAEEAQPEEEDEPDDYLSMEIDERDLRIIFSGICRSRANQRQVESEMDSKK